MKAVRPTERGRSSALPGRYGGGVASVTEEPRPQAAFTVTGQRHTYSLSSKRNHGMRTFTGLATTPHTTSLPTGYYAVNARLVSGCSGSTSQSWAGQLQW